MAILISILASSRPLIIYVSSGSNTVAVGIIAGVAVLLASGISGFVAWKIASSKGETAQKLAGEDRRQSRIQEAYLTIHLYVDKWQRYADCRSRGVRLVGEGEPELPNVSDVAAGVAALVASDEVDAEMVVFSTNLMAFRSAVGAHDQAIAITRASRDEIDELTRAREEVRTKAMTLATQAEVVHNMMRRELAAG
jgi:hypothetical protein